MHFFFLSFRRAGVRLIIATSLYSGRGSSYRSEVEEVENFSHRIVTGRQVTLAQKPLNLKMFLAS